MLQKLIAVILLCTISLCGCGKASTIEEGEPAKSAFAESNSTQPLQMSGLYIALPQLQRDYLKLCDSCWGAFGDGTKPRQAAVFADIGDDANFQKETYLVVDGLEAPLSCPLGTTEPVSFSQCSILPVDLQGDGKDEILVFRQLNGNGATQTQIFAVENDQIKLIYDLGECLFELQTEFVDEDTLRIKSEKYGLSGETDVSGVVFPSWFSDSFDVSTIYACTPMQNDGVTQIVCRRMVFETEISYWLTVDFTYNQKTDKLEFGDITLTPVYKTGDGLREP